MPTQICKLPTPAQKWAQRRNFYLFKLEGAKGSLNPPSDLLDAQLCELGYQAENIIQRMISRVERLHSSYETRVERSND